MSQGERSERAELLAAANSRVKSQAVEITRLKALNEDLSHRMGEMALRLNQTVAELSSYRSRRGPSNIETVRDLVTAAEYRDHDTGAHLVRIGYFTALLAPVCGCDEELTHQMMIASPMHDVGKIGIPDHILKKRGTLDREEREIMECHAEYGARILAGSDSPVMQLASEMARTHHERFDGNGYPHRLKGEEIPLSGRIVAIVDVFDALAMERTYRKAMEVDVALELIRRGRGNQFDPEVVDAFFSIGGDLLEMRDRINRGERPEAFPRVAGFPEENPLAFYDSPLHSTVHRINGESRSREGF